ncbi:MAG TPA: PQQ-dependent sugar dehydrogenase [Gemmatimonadaceae bacterium]|nr:PQQ-dependent sugar dehydrogenase [Gemmatimonadaceae bacterium]
MRAQLTVFALGAVLAVPVMRSAQQPRRMGCDEKNAGLTLPPGFCAGVYARGLSGVRHMVVAPNGDLFVIENPARVRPAQPGQPAPPARGIYRLRDFNGNGRADSVTRVADGTGSGLFLANGHLYSEAGNCSLSKCAIVRYELKTNSSDLTGKVDTLVVNVPGPAGHTSREMVVRGSDLFVNVGSASNVCDAPDAKPGAPSADPCPELPTRAGIWKFSAVARGQDFSSGQRFVTGLRNGPSLTLNPKDNEMYVVQHGRDNVNIGLGRDSVFNAENPGEEFFHIVANADYGWPYCFYSMEAKKKLTNPEYGGDGKKDDRCRDKAQPIYAFPGHWAPDGLLFYTGSQFPAEYKDGAFVAFHGSWNRAPLPQAGFNVTFLPFKDGKATGAHRVFADGFYDNRPAPGASHRPVGLAQGADGSIFVSDDAGGLIYKIVYTGRK